MLNFYFEIGICPTYSSCFDVVPTFVTDAEVNCIVGFDSHCLLVVVVSKGVGILTIIMITGSEVPLSVILAEVIGSQA